MSTHYLASNQLRLWLATLAYLLLERVRAGAGLVVSRTWLTPTCRWRGISNGKNGRRLGKIPWETGFPGEPTPPNSRQFPQLVGL